LSKLVPAHGGAGLKPLLLEGGLRKEEATKAARLKRVPMTSRETSDLIMLGIGPSRPSPASWAGTTGRPAATSIDPLAGRPLLAHPITLSAEPSVADSIRKGEDVALWDTETDALMGTMTVEEKYGIDKDHECRQVFARPTRSTPGSRRSWPRGRSTWPGR